MTRLNIGTDKGNITNVTTKKKFDDIKMADILQILKRRKIEGAVVQGWCEIKPDEVYVGFVKIWCEAYPTLGFNATSGKVIKELIKETQWRMEKGGKEITIEKTIAAFQYVVNYVKRINHFVNYKPITTFRQQYLSIITEIERGKQPVKQTTRDIIRNL